MDCVRSHSSEIVVSLQGGLSVLVRKRIADGSWAGRTVSMRNEENVKRVDDLLAMDHRILVCYISDTRGINCKMVHLKPATDDS